MLYWAGHGQGIDRLARGVVVAVAAVIGIFPALSVAGETEAPPVATRQQVVWLDPDQGGSPYSYPGRISIELFRQAMLIAARDGLGLQTRDGQLREWHTRPANSRVMRMEFRLNKILLIGPDQSFSAAQTKEYDFKGPDPYLGMLEVAEKLSRQDDVDYLRRQGWTGKANFQKRGAPAPDDALEDVSQMEELPQFAALREVHALIRNDGESLDRLGVLVRAYANLGQLTRYHWSLDFGVYAARSLLYAQRMVASDPHSAVALWHRAYARAFAGLPDDALADIAAAAKLKKGPPPLWIAMIDAYCRYNRADLSALMVKTRQWRGLATFLSFLTVEHSQAENLMIHLDRKAIYNNPRCMRLLDAMCDTDCDKNLGEAVGDLNYALNQSLRYKLDAVPGVSANLADQVDAYEHHSDDPHALQILWQSLLMAGAPDKDAAEPSLSAVGRNIEESAFVYMVREAHMQAVDANVDASPYTNVVAPTVMDHPFAFVLKAYGLMNGNSDDVVRKALSPTWAIGKYYTIHEQLLLQLLWQYKPVPNGPAYFEQWAEWNADNTAADLEPLMEHYSYMGADPHIAGRLDVLRAIASHSPIGVAASIYPKWSIENARAWEKQYWDYPTVAMKLGQKYMEWHLWDDAARCYREYVDISPDVYGYNALGQVYLTQRKDDQWAAVEEEFLKTKDNFGRGKDMMRASLAGYYMEKGNKQAAEAHADAAVKDDSLEGLRAKALMQAQQGDWKTADEMYQRTWSEYRDDPYEWYAFCIRSGHGSHNAALAAMDQFLTDRFADCDQWELMELAAMQITEKRDAEAIKTLRREFSIERQHTALNDEVTAVICDRMNDAAGRDAALDRACARNDLDHIYTDYALVLRAAIKKGVGTPPSELRIKALMRRGGGPQSWIGGLTAIYLDHHGQKDLAKTYLQMCKYYNDSDVGRTIVESMLHGYGIDPPQAWIKP